MGQHSSVSRARRAEVLRAHSPANLTERTNFRLSERPSPKITQSPTENDTTIHLSPLHTCTGEHILSSLHMQACTRTRKTSEEEKEEREKEEDLTVTATGDDNERSRPDSGKTSPTASASPGEVRDGLDRVGQTRWELASCGWIEMSNVRDEMTGQGNAE